MITSTLLENWKKNPVKHESDIYTNCDWCFCYSNYRIIKETEGLRSWRTIGNHPSDSIIEKDQYWEESWRLVETCCHSNSSERPSAKTDVKSSNE